LNTDDNLYKFDATRIELLQTVIVSVMLIVIIDLLTNSIDTTLFEGDFIFYIDMAENGILGNSSLVAPFAYRPLTPFLASLISTFTGISTMMGYQVIAWGGALFTLVSSYALTRVFGGSHRHGLISVIIIGLTFYHLKYLLFDVYRPDHLAYGLTSFAFIALVQKRYWLCIGLSAIGGLTREFTLVPLALLLLQQLVWLVQEGDSRKQIMSRIIVGGGVIVVFVIVPRLFISVESTVVYATLFKPNPTSIETITLPLTSFRRNLNLIFAVLAYTLPILWLGGIHQLKAVWENLGSTRGLVVGYTFFVIGLTLIGGTDLARFVTYLHVPLIIIVTLMLNRKPSVILLIGMFITLLIFNRIPFLLPQEDYNNFIDFYGAYHDRVNPNIILRWQELVVFMFIAGGIRGGIDIVQRDRKAKSRED